MGRAALELLPCSARSNFLPLTLNINTISRRAWGGVRPVAQRELCVRNAFYLRKDVRCRFAWQPTVLLTTWPVELDAPHYAKKAGRLSNGH